VGVEQTDAARGLSARARRHTGLSGALSARAPQQSDLQVRSELAGDMGVGAAALSVAEAVHGGSLLARARLAAIR